MSRLSDKYDWFPEEEFIFKEETRRIIGACFEVHKALGSGFLESVYHEALAIEFSERKIPFNSDVKLEVSYKGKKLEKFFTADFVCFDSIVLEIKALSDLRPEHSAQVLNYLKATGMELGLLINFGTPKVQIKRLIM
ncbi:MAG: hypothetical protein A2X22_10235 [Bacteroidetes bacterium GWF2_49_14]|nr:MAG: hypothetical protein A2X22_10235 [Bacteroidetes bacterium GWF2_49_14]HBB92394.1 GxxExxY protein [Bacteroidales bacterium]